MSSGKDKRFSRRILIDSEKCGPLCTCGREHRTPLIEVVSGEEAYSVLAEDCAKRYAGRSVLLLDDENTHLAAGAAVSRLLERSGVSFEPVTLPGGPVATDDLAGRIHDQSIEHSLIIAVGAGTINDLGKYVADNREIPCWSVPTAPSMNGYTSSVAAIKIRGLKRTLPALPARSIYVDPEILRHSPLEMRQAGFCDVMAKSVSDIDWQIESLLFNGAYCALPSAISAESEGRFIDNPEKIARGDVEAMLGLFEGLLFSGAAMSLAGSSAPASGGEHLISHFLDMREVITGMKPNLHGLQVGAGIVLSAVCYRRLASLEERELKRNAQEVFKADARRILSVWGSLATEVEKQFLNKRERLLQFDSKLPEKWERLKELFGRVYAPEFFVDLFRRTGLEMTLSSLEISKDEFLLGAITARTIRDRLTVLDIAAHAGILEDAAYRTIEILS